jgi:hypothetical protein
VLPVIVAFTKFDLLVSQSLTDSESGSTPHRRNRAYIQCEQACHSKLGKAPQDVPAEIVSSSYYSHLRGSGMILNVLHLFSGKFSDLIDRLIVTTDGFIMGSRVPSRSRSSTQGPKPRIAPVPLTWSAALRVRQDIIIQASIECVLLSRGSQLINLFWFPELGEAASTYTPQTEANSDRFIFPLGYWRSLWSSLDFADQPLKNCVNIIHVDIIEVWNLNDKTSVSYPQLSCCFSSCSRRPEFVEYRIHGAHVSCCQRFGWAGWRWTSEVSVLLMNQTGRPVIRFSGSPDPGGSGDRYAEWVYDIYRGR